MASARPKTAARRVLAPTDSPVLITDSTSEIADDPEKPNTVKFTWRYAENRIAQRNPLGVGIFTEHYDYTFR